MNRIKSFFAVWIGGRSKWTVPLLLTALGVSILGAFPDSQFFWMKCHVAEWAFIIFLSLVFLKDKWLSAFFIVCLLNAIRTFNLGGDYRITAITGFYYILLYLVIYQILLCKLKQNNVKTIINGLCTIMLIQLAYMYFQLFGIDPIFRLGEPYVSRPAMSNLIGPLVTGFWGHTNISGASLAITLPLFFRRRWWIAIPFIVVMLVCTQSLGAVIAGVCGVVFYLIFVKTVIPKKWIFISVSIFICGYCILIDPGHFNPKNDRIEFLKPTLKMIKRHPVIGYGLEQYKIAFRQINKHVFKGKGATTHAHNEFAETVVNLGGIGGVIIIGFFLSLFWYFVHNITSLSIIAMSGVVIGLVNSCSTFIFHTPLAWVILVLMVLVRKENPVILRRKICLN